MLESALLTHNDILHVAKLIHNYFRKLEKTRRSEAMPVLLEFTDRVIEDLRTGAVPPHHAANLHLLSFLKEAGHFDRAVRFWEWLKQKSNDFVDAAVYGAAIELLTMQGKADLAELEAVYAEGLRRFPGNFAQYHLSPEAMVPDRGRPVEIKGLPTSLLQGIISARIERGDWRNAYLGFDTALRLFPTQVPERFFEMFVYKRPLAESYTVFAMACRSGVSLRPEILTALLKKVVGIQPRASAEDRILAIKGMLNAIHVYVGVGGSVSCHHLSVLVKGFEELLPKAPQGNPASEAVNRLVGNTARETVLTISQAGVPLTSSTVASMAGLAGKARLPELLGRTIQDMASAGMEPNEVVHRAMVLAAGQIKHLELLELSWKRLVEAAEASGTQLDVIDWKALARASVSAGHIRFLREQTTSLSHTMTDDIRHSIEYEVAEERTGETPKRSRRTQEFRGVEFTEADSALVNAAVPEIKSQVKSTAALMKSDKLLNFYEHAPPMSLVARPAIGSETALRTVYDELTTDPRLPATNQPLRPAKKSAFGYPLDALRYANWKSINELLLDAEAYEAERQRRMEEAMKESGDSTRMEPSVRGSLHFKLSPHGFRRDRSGIAAEDDAAHASDEIGRVRREIHRLRALQDQPRFALDP